MDSLVEVIVLLTGCLHYITSHANTSLMVIVVEDDGGDVSAVIQGFSCQDTCNSSQSVLDVQVEHVIARQHLGVDIEALFKVYSLSSFAVNVAVVAFSTTSGCTPTNSLITVSDNFSWCHMYISDVTCHLPMLTSYKQVDFRPDVVTTLRRVVELLFMQGEEKLLFFYDSKFASLLAPAFAHIWRSEDIWMFDADMFKHDDGDTMMRMISLRASHMVILAVLTKNTLSILNKARSLDFFGPQHTWILFNLDIDPMDTEALLMGPENLVVIDLRSRFQRPYVHHSLYDVFHNLTLPEQDLVVPIQLALCSCCCLAPVSYDYVNELLNISHNTQDISSLKETIEAATSYGVWSTTGDGHPQLHLEGYWNPHSDTSQFPTSLVKPFTGFHGRVFNITSKPNELFQILLPNGTFTGLAFDILNELGRKFNFSYIVTQPPDNQWGIETEDGTWNGMVGLVKRHEVDFGVASFTITYHRESVIDFTTPVWQGSHSMVMRINPQGNKLFVYLNPFKMEVWLSLLAMIPVCTVVLWFLTHYTSFYNHSTTKKQTESLQRHRKVALSTLAVLVLGGQFNQGMPWRPKSVSGRCLVGFLWLYIVIVSATYTGNLIAALAVPSIKAPVETLGDLATQSKYTVGLVQGQALVQVLKTAKTGDFQTIWQQVATDMRANLMPNLEKGFERVLSDQFIFMDDTKNVVAKVAAANDCSLHIAREEFYYTGYGFPLQHGAPYLDMFNRAILHMLESGHINQWMQKYWPHPPPCGAAFGKAGEALTLQDTEGAFLLLYAGCGLASFALIVECFWMYFGQKKMKHFLESRQHSMPSVYPQ